MNSKQINQPVDHYSCHISGTITKPEPENQCLNKKHSYGRGKTNGDIVRSFKKHYPDFPVYWYEIQGIPVFYLLQS